MGTRFIHTADWQIGKPFAGIEDVHKCALVQQERLNMIQRIGEAAVQHRAEFILVAGDLFDTPTVTKATVTAACSAIGRLGVPVLAIATAARLACAGEQFTMDMVFTQSAAENGNESPTV
ncbi:MAG: hypothetical protein ABJF10_26735 [Chthoniobacter sp.]|uniref:metallophosphoesterase family protein n=1 Tax=Chthoniobacter sp. TaxID=2510640 RepID=UPI0032A9EB1A